ncbi:MAG: CehA/McbA family metallohydrolase [Phycisphaerae bacterium]
MHERIGAIHLHSVYSDGSETLREIIAAAARAGLDYLVVTDHDTRRAADDGWQGWHDGVLVVVGVEVSCRHRTHVVVLGDADARGLRLKPLRRVLFDLTRQGAWPFVAHAHPAHIMGISLKAGPLHEWEVPGFTGVELWSLMHDVCDGLTPWRIPSFPYTWRRRIRGPHPDTVAHWDRITQDRRFVAIGSLDNHAVAVPVVGHRILPYEEVFRALRTHVLVDEAAGDETAADASDRLLRAIVAGRCFIALDETAEARGFHFEGRCEAGGDLLAMGEERTWTGPVHLAVRSPHAARLLLRRNGEVVAETDGADALDHRAEGPGVYRAEAHLAGLPWVYTNPIYLRGNA